MLPLHIVIAFASIGLFAAGIFSDKKALKIAAGVSAVATLASGIGLIIAQPTALSHACISGTVYLAVVISLSRAPQLKRFGTKV